MRAPVDWLKLDSYLPRHPKLAGLTAAEKWGFVAALCDAKQRRTGTWVSRAHYRTCLGSDARALKALLKAGLLREEVDGSISIPNWDHWQAASSGAARQRRWRERHKDVTRDGDGGGGDVARDVTSVTETETETSPLLPFGEGSPQTDRSLFSLHYAWRGRAPTPRMVDQINRWATRFGEDALVTEVEKALREGHPDPFGVAATRLYEAGVTAQRSDDYDALIERDPIQ